MTTFDDDHVGGHHDEGDPPRPRQWRRRHLDQHPWSIDRIVITIVAVLTIVSLIFSLGVNYQRLSSIEGRFASFQHAAETDYVRRDVSAAQWGSVDYQLQQLRMQVEILTKIVMDAQGQQRRSPSQSPGPRF